MTVFPLLLASVPSAFLENGCKLNLFPPPPLSLCLSLGNAAGYRLRKQSVTRKDLRGMREPCVGQPFFFFLLFLKNGGREVYESDRAARQGKQVEAGRGTSPDSGGKVEGDDLR